MALTAERKAELMAEYMALPKCTCVFKSRAGYAEIRFSDVADCAYCTGVEKINAELTAAEGQEGN